MERKKSQVLKIFVRQKKILGKKNILKFFENFQGPGIWTQKKSQVSDMEKKSQVLKVFCLAEKSFFLK